jgi:hypothetical protein
VISAIVRIVISLVIDITAQEAYYKSFALFPELSSFDQPPMIGWLIQLTTNNFALNSQFFLRLGAMICGMLTSWVIFITGRRIFSKASGFYSVVIYNTSFFFAIFTGTYVIPESPFTLFYLLTFYFISESLYPRIKDSVESRMLSNNAYILSGIFSGLALLSKYTSLAIWPSVIFYLLFNNKKEFKNKYLYLALTISLMFILLTSLLNFGKDFPGIDYLKGSINLSEHHFSEMIFNFLMLIFLISPFLIILIIRGVKTSTQDNSTQKKNKRLIYFISFGNAIPVMVLSFFTNEFILSLPTLLFPLVYIASYNLSEEEKDTKLMRRTVRKSSICYISWIILLMVVYTTGVLNFNPFFRSGINREAPGYISASAIGNSPFSNMLFDNYGWNNLSNEFAGFINQENKFRKKNYYIIADNYLSAALSSFYLADKSEMKVKTAGKLFDTRKFHLITQKNGSFNYGDNAIYIDYFNNPQKSKDFGNRYFRKVRIASVIYIERINYPTKKITIYEFSEMIKIPETTIKK